jgi:hypothetical protein
MTVSEDSLHTVIRTWKFLSKPLRLLVTDVFHYAFHGSLPHCKGGPCVRDVLTPRSGLLYVIPGTNGLFNKFVLLGWSDRVVVVAGITERQQTTRGTKAWVGRWMYVSYERLKSLAASCEIVVTYGLKKHTASETLVSTYKSTRRHYSEDRH